MTIAAGYFTHEGVVLGADSTTTFSAVSPEGAVHHFFNHGQKLFEVGEGSTLGMVTWGMASFVDVSHRTLIARFADSIKDRNLTLAEAAKEWSHTLWNSYNMTYAHDQLKPLRDRARELASKPTRSPEEQATLETIPQNVLGFCLAGHLGADRSPGAFEIQYSILSEGEATPTPLEPGKLYSWGMPHFHHRLMYGIDPGIYEKILKSGRWNGSEEDLIKIVQQHVHQPGAPLPLRDAVDWVFSLIYSTIKGMKFSHLHQMCGGPIEIAVISSDRKFRWVHHKDFNSATGRNFLTET